MILNNNSSCSNLFKSSQNFDSIDNGNESSINKVHKKLIQSKKMSDKENKRLTKETETGEDLDEGVQGIKKSVVPIRCISNLMSSASF
jgi:hypothetical protein